MIVSSLSSSRLAEKSSIRIPFPARLWALRILTSNLKVTSGLWIKLNNINQKRMWPVIIFCRIKAVIFMSLAVCMATKRRLTLCSLLREIWLGKIWEGFWRLLARVKNKVARVCKMINQKELNRLIIWI